MVTIYRFYKRTCNHYAHRLLPNLSFSLSLFLSLSFSLYLSLYLSIYLSFCLSLSLFLSLFLYFSLALPFLFCLSSALKKTKTKKERERGTNPQINLFALVNSPFSKNSLFKFLKAVCINDWFSFHFAITNCLIFFCLILSSSSLLLRLLFHKPFYFLNFDCILNDHETKG
mgnify:CR=1 FL=1